MHYLDTYNVVWHTQSAHSGEGMPVGGHDTGLHVWVEQGDILFYIDRSGSFDENNQMLKLGRVRLTFDPSPFADGTMFRQELLLREGRMEIEGRTANGQHGLVNLWLETDQSVIHIEATTSEAVTMTVQYENWRMAEREIPHDRRMSSTSVVGYPGRVVTYPDDVRWDGDGIAFHHRNRDDALIFDAVVAQQGLAAVKDELWNPQYQCTFGGIMRGDAMQRAGTADGTYLGTRFHAWRLASTQPTTDHHATIALHTAQTPTIDDWLADMRERSDAALRDVEGARQRAVQWWNAFWDRSFIAVDPERKLDDPQPWQVGRNYQVFRYMLGCNAHGAYPTKFNGGLFTSDPVHVLNEDGWREETADFRRWGGGSFTAQNQRLVYWPMIRSGDWDMMQPQFTFYQRALRNAELRTEVYWGHAGCSFTEQIENFGLPLGWSWGWPDSPDLVHRRTPFMDPTEQVAPWIKYYYTTQLEWAYMILKYHLYSGASIAAYLPFIESSIRFFDEHYQYLFRLEALKSLDGNGKLVLFPSTACETYKLAMNPTDLIAALDATVRAMLDLPAAVLDDEQRSYYAGLLDRIPPWAFREREGHTTIAPAEHWKGIINVEIPQLYPVFPYEQYGIGRPDIDIAINTWRYGTDIPEQKDHISWHQDAIFCARLGLTDEAAQITILKLADGNCRFPAYWGPGHDWLPDHNCGGSGMVGLQEMLMQTNGDAIYVLPAWPRTWDVDWKLYAPHNTTVEGSVRDGALVRLTVTPPERAKDVVNMWEQPGNEPQT